MSVMGRLHDNQLSLCAKKQNSEYIKLKKVESLLKYTYLFIFIIFLINNRSNNLPFISSLQQSMIQIYDTIPQNGCSS